MKIIQNPSLAKRLMIPLSLIVFALGYSCEDSENVTIPSVDTFIYPEENDELQLLNTPVAQTSFEWEAPVPAAASSPRYEVVFAKDAGFNEVLGRFSAVSGGVAPIAYVRHDDLNKMLADAGFKMGEVCNVYWSVNSFRDDNFAMAKASPRKIALIRHKGFIEKPSQVYLTGAATDYGNDIANAKDFHWVSTESKFELFAFLTKDQNFTLIDNKGDSYKNFTVENGMFIEGDAPLTVDETAFYRIILNFNASTCLIEKAEKLRYVVTTTKVATELQYVGGNVWALENHVLALDGANDNRYHFRMDIGGKEYKLGNGSAGTVTPQTPKTYFKLFYYDPAEALFSNNSFRLRSDKNKSGNHVTISVSLHYDDAETGQYFHNIEYLD